MEEIPLKMIGEEVGLCGSVRNLGAVSCQAVLDAYMGMAYSARGNIDDGKF